MHMILNSSIFIGYNKVIIMIPSVKVKRDNSQDVFALLKATEFYNIMFIV